MYILTSAVIIITFIVETNAVSVNCTILKNEFGSAVSNFTYCAITNSHPIKLCQTCVNVYMDVLETYTNLSESTDANGTVCYDKYRSLDRLNIIQTMYINSQNLWNTAKCRECFIIVNGTLTPERADAIIKFYDLYQNTEECIDNEYTQNNFNMCKNCMDEYVELSDYYESISNENEAIAMCMDIVDLMNGTRKAWSEECCKYRQHEEYIFIISTCLVLLITIVFYSLTKLLIDKKSPAVFSQSRFAESLGHTFRQ